MHEADTNIVWPSSNVGVIVIVAHSLKVSVVRIEPTMSGSVLLGKKAKVPLQQIRQNAVVIIKHRQSFISGLKTIVRITE